MSFDVNKKVIEDSECLDLTLALICNGIAEECVIEDGCVKIPSLKATVKAKVMGIKHNKKEGICYADIMYSISHESFDEEVLEELTGFGKSLKGAVAVSVYNFVSITFCGFRKAVTGKYMTHLETTFQSKQHKWHVSDSCAKMLNDGSDDPENADCYGYFEVWEAIKKVLPKYLGNKKYYWINIYGAKSENGSVVAKVTINNRTCKELSNLFAEAVGDFEDEKFSSIKRFYYITQDESTYKPYPYSRKEIEESTIKVLRILEDCVKKEQFLEYHKRVKEAISDKYLAIEFLAFIPEICAINAYTDVGFAEYIGIRRDGVSDMELVNISQFTNYYWIERALLSALQTGKMSSDLYNTCISISTTYRAVVNLRKENKNADLTQEELCFAFGAPTDYIVR